ncbi:DUF1599 domain-containing protein, partial [Dysosmobacter welbionis]
KHAAGRHAGDAPLGAEDQRQYQGQQEDQHLCKGVGVVEIGLHPAGHTGVDLQVHIGLVDLHALDPLVHTVQRGHQHTDPTAGGQPLQILCAPDSADRHQHAQRCGDMVEQEAEGGGG